MQPKKRTLVILTPGFPKDEGDNNCIPDRQNFVRTLKSNFPGLNIIVLAFQYPFEVKVISWFGIEVICFNGQNKGQLNRLITWYKVWKTLKTLNKSNQIIGLLSFWVGECSFIGKLFAKCHSLEHYSWILGQDAKKDNKYVKLIHPKGQGLIALSDFLADEFYRNYTIKPEHIIPNGINPSFFSAVNSERDIDILGAGSLIPLKQYDVLIRVISGLRRQISIKKVLIVGKGPEANSLLDLVKSLDLNDKILLPGERPHHEVLQLMQRTRIFLHPSSYEGFSSVCLEALNAGAHVVSFCKPMNTNIKHWHIVNNEDEMLQKALEILKDSYTDHSQVMPFSMDDNARMVMELYSG